MRVLTLGKLATRRQHYGVGQLRQQPAGRFLLFAGLAATLMISYIVYERWLA